MRKVADYLAKVPPLHASKPKFMATIAAVMQPFADAQALLDGMPLVFDLDTAVGVQLDATGAWIGKTRIIPIPIPNAFFSFDTPGLGWDQGYWAGTFGDPSTYFVSLDDDTYRRLLYAKVLCNSSDGTIAKIQAIFDSYFTGAAYPSTMVAVFDNGLPPSNTQWFSFDDALRGFDVSNWYSGGSLGNYASADMSIEVVIGGAWPTVVDLEILAQKLLPFAPSGVRIDYAVTTANGAPVFGVDLETPYISGLDVGAWAKDPDYVAQNLSTH